MGTREALQVLVAFAVTIVGVGCLGDEEEHPRRPNPGKATPKQTLTTADEQAAEQAGGLGLPDADLMRDYAKTMVGVPRGEPRPFVPDETAALSFTHRSSAMVEVIGVCQATEAGAECWDASGKRDPGLTGRLLKAMDEKYSPAMIQLVVGRKNRMLVVRTWWPVGEDWVTVEPYSTEFYGRSWSTTLNPGGNSQKSGDGHESTNLLMQDYPRDATIGAFYCLFSDNLPTLPRLTMRVGAKAMFGPATVELTSIKRVADAPKDTGWPSRARWVVEFKLESPDGRSFVPFVTAVDKVGRRIVGWTDDGKLMTAEAVKAWNDAYRDERPPGRKKAPVAAYRWPVCHRLGPGGFDGKHAFALHIDPAKLQSLELSGRTSDVVKVTGVPLDPR